MRVRTEGMLTTRRDGSAESQPDLVSVVETKKDFESHSRRTGIADKSTAISDKAKQKAMC